MSEQKEILKSGIEKPLSAEPTKAEVLVSPEKKVEGTNQVVTEKPSEVLAPTATTITNPVITPELERRAEIERILEEDLSSVYFNLPEEKKGEFKNKGEETAKEINVLLSATKIKVQKIIKLIKDWLLLIPGVNRFFLEQEAKLKADEIIKIKDKF